MNKGQAIIKDYSLGCRISVGVIKDIFGEHRDGFSLTK